MSLPRHPLTATSLLLLLLLVIACSQQDQDETLVVYSAGPRVLAEQVAEAFESEKGVRVELFAATTGQVMARLEAERYRPRADVVVFASRSAAEALKQDGRLLAYPNPDWWEDSREEWHDPDQYYFATSAALVGMALRADKDENLDWATVFAGEGPGRVTMPSPSRSGSAGDFLVAYSLQRGEAAARDDFRAARQHGLIFSAANSQAISGLVVGTYDVILAAADYLIYRQIDAGADIRMHYPPSGSALVERPVAVLADTPVPQLARHFVDFYLSEAMQEAVAAQHLLPARTGVEPSALRRHAEAPATFDVDPVAAWEQQATILRRFQIRVERAEVIPAESTP
ncbi:extracellular solute-binding protein [Gammaproteobacteria bacterium AB-CW1]|uniref:Extracellular solute-binding protein n=1 Tax=Natronospira elongata TaxID=3110268 RepID=A0AAP6JDM8_9GAMM|nr:extracellular solute-binding protein [Gammaproteobacteria bacterium AB-CW1]